MNDGLFFSWVLNLPQIPNSKLSVSVWLIDWLIDNLIADCLLIDSFDELKCNYIYRFNRNKYEN